METSIQKWDDEEREIIKKQFCVGASDAEIAYFFAVAKRLQLDPFAKQIWLVPQRQKVNSEWVEKRIPIVSIDGARVVAARTGSYAPGEKTTYQYDDKGKLVMATASVRLFVQGTWHTVSEDALLVEYAKRGRDGALLGLWATMQHVMLAKCAEMRALRRIAPMMLGDIYIREELEQAENEPLVVMTEAQQLAAGSTNFLDFDNNVTELLLRLDSAESVNDIAKASSEIAALKLDRQGPAHSALLAAYKQADARLKKAAKASKEAA